MPGTVPAVDWSQVWSAAVAAGIVSAIANGLFALWRHAAETKARRRETQHGHLRNAAADFLAAEASVWRHDERVRNADDYNDARIRRIARGRPAPDDISELHTEFLRDRAEAEGEARNAVGRMRLYSQTMHEHAEALLGVRHQSRLGRDGADDPALEQREQALRVFVDAARAELGVRF